MVGNIPASVMVVAGGDLNGHVGANVDSYDEVHGGYGFGAKMWKIRGCWNSVMQCHWL